MGQYNHQQSASSMADDASSKDVPRRERDWASEVRSLNAQMAANIQTSHNSLMHMTRTYNELADRVCPSGASRRSRAEAASVHAARMQDVSMEVEVVRAEMKHLALLVQLFDQYRSFFHQQSDPQAVSQYLEDRLSKNQSAIFIALPVLSQ